MELTFDTVKARLKEWKGCPLAASANPVLGEGSPNAEVMFIGEAPGEMENKLGRPFVGPAGKFLDELLAGIGFKREDVYISNVVKYRPPGNRDPTPEEKEQCIPWLMLEIALLRPRVIVPLGRHALGHFFTHLNITSSHGKPQRLAPRLRSGSSTLRPAQGDLREITIFPIYHPAAALHNPALREALVQDFQSLKRFLEACPQAT